MNRATLMHKLAEASDAIYDMIEDDPDDSLADLARMLDDAIVAEAKRIVSLVRNND